MSKESRVWDYWEERAEAVESYFLEHGLELPNDIEALVDITEAQIVGDDERLALAQEEAAHPRRRAKLLEKKLRQHYCTPIPHDEDDVYPWGIVSPEDMEEDDW